MFTIFRATCIMNLSLENYLCNFAGKDWLIMNKDERQQKIDEFNKRMKEFGDKVFFIENDAKVMPTGMKAKNTILYR